MAIPLDVAFLHCPHGRGRFCCVKSGRGNGQRPRLGFPILWNKRIQVCQNASGASRRSEGSESFRHRVRNGLSAGLRCERFHRRRDCMLCSLSDRSRALSLVWFPVSASYICEPSARFETIRENFRMAPDIQSATVSFFGSAASRPRLSASRRKHSPLNAVGGTPTAATETVALPNPKRKFADG